MVALFVVATQLFPAVAYGQNCYESSILSPTPFMGNNGEVFKLADGSLWEVKYEYKYLYEYYPKVTICPGRGVLLLRSQTLRVQKVASAADPKVPPGQAERVGGLPAVAVQSAYLTKVESESNGVLRLANGAIVEVTSGFLGFLGLRKDAVLLASDSRCRLWIEGKRTYRCSVLKAPSAKPVAAALTSIVSVSSGGGVIRTLDGAIYEVDSLDRIYTSLWLPGSEVAVFGGTGMLNLDQGDGIITVARLK